MMYNNIEFFIPQSIYLMINFDIIKNDLKTMKSIYKDYGSIIVLQEEDMLITVNSIGKVEIYYNNTVKTKNMDAHLCEIENAFKKQITNFRLIKN